MQKIYFKTCQCKWNHKLGKKDVYVLHFLLVPPTTEAHTQDYGKS